MATAEQAGATANNSSYGGGGAGGKFRKKPLRRQATPYDRPPTVHRSPTNDDSSPSWLTKLVVDPASKLISYGASRFFGSLIRKRLPAPPSPPPPPQQQPSEVNLDGGVQFEDALPSQPEPPNELALRESSQQEIKVSESSQFVNNPNSNGISDLAQLLKQKTFTRSEIAHLTGLLQSKAGEMSHGDEYEKETTSVFDRHEKVAVESPDENRNKGISSNVSTPIFSSKVLEDDIGSPAELAKAYMGSRPSKVSPSMLGMHGQVGRENPGMLGSIPFSSKTPIVPLARRSSVSLGATENGFTTPRSRGRSAIYNMARTPYSRGHQTSIGGGNTSNDFGLPKPSQRLAISEHGEKLDSMSATLKRRSSYLDDDIGSVGPIRRIRQKHNLLVPRVPHTVHGAGIGSAKNQHPLIGQASHELSKSISGKENGSLASTSHASVPTQSTEVASRILQHLEKLSPKEKLSESKLAAHKSSEFKFVAPQDKSPFKLTSGMLRGQALRSMEDVGASKFMLQSQDDRKVEDRSNGKLPESPELTSQNQEKVEGILHTESAVSMKSHASYIKISDSPVRNGASQPPQKKRAFRMSAQEDSFEQEDDVHYNGSSSIPATDRNGPTGVPPMENNFSAAKTSKSVETSSFVLGKTTEFGGSGSAKTGEGSGGLAFPASEEAGKASQAVLSPLSTSSDKAKDNPPPLFSFSSTVGDKVPTLPLESSGTVHAAKLDSSSSFSTATPNSSQLKAAESDEAVLNDQKPSEKNVEPDSILAASNGPFGSKPHGFSFTPPAANDKNQVSAGVDVLSNSSTSIAEFPSAGTGTNKSATSTGSIFGSTVAPATVFKFGSADPSSSITFTSTANISAADSKTETEKDKSFGSSDFAVPAFAATSSGSSTFGLASASLNNLQGSLFSGTIKSDTSGGGDTVPQGLSVQSISSTSLPSFSSTSIGSLSNSQTSNPKPTFQFGSSASLSGIADTPPVSGPPPSLAKFGASSTTVADTNAISSNSNTPGVFSFGLSSSTTSTNTIGSTPAATSAPFVFGNSPSPAPAVNTSSTFGTGTSPFIFGGNSTSSSAAVSSTTSSSAPNVFGSSQSSPAPVFASAFPSTPSTGFKFGASSTPATSSTPTGSAAGPIFSFTSSTPSVFSTPTSGFGASPGNNDQMNAEDSMAEDPVQSSMPIFGQQAVSQPAASIFGQQAVSQSTTPLFGQPAASPAPTPIFGQPPAQPAVPQSPAPIFGQPAASPSPGFMFGQSAPMQANPFPFGGQPSQAGAVNPNPFQASGSLEFNAGGSFSLGSGGGDKGNRRRINVSKTKNRKK